MVLTAGTVGLLGAPQTATAVHTMAGPARMHDGAGERSRGFVEIRTAAEVPRDGLVQADRLELSYVVNTNTDASTIRAVKEAIGKAGGSVIVAHDRIGVIVARSANAGFATSMRRIAGVQSAGATRTAPLTASGAADVAMPDKMRTSGSDVAWAAARAPRQEPLEPLQWDIAMIRADKAAKVTPGSRDVTVAVIDSGVDDTHPDLAPNFSAKQSANCVGGVADTTQGAWRPYTEDDYHGTHVAGTIAAARNGLGMAGVAPGVKVSSIKVSEPETSLYFGEAVVCAFMFAADHGIEVTNNSYYIDPWMFNCKEDPDQAAIVEAVARAAKYAERKGVIHVAAAGNSNFDLAAKSLIDTSSPNDTTPVSREIDPSVCWDIPTQLPGVVTVSATGPKNLKSKYSNYGLEQIDVAAPGGDESQVPNAPARAGQILSTMPDGGYGYLQGTSMAAPHAAGVVALIKSKRPNASQGEIQWLLKKHADNPGCSVGPYDPDNDGKVDAKCTGSKLYNSFYGFGIVDALDAVQ
ncbi:S8 family serine peptidase [Streptomyces sp. NPDC093982]|uniref:S8 family peptidase n=1 Tax=Streptomyces sp. NPDC093982 TaxID=3155077 RepID=UPI003446FA06